MRNKSESPPDVEGGNDPLPGCSLVVVLFVLFGIQILLSLVNPVTQNLSEPGVTGVDDKTRYLTHWVAVGAWIPVSIIPLVILIRMFLRMGSRGSGLVQEGRLLRFSDFLLKFDLFAIFLWFEIIALLLMADGSAMDVKRSGDGIAIRATRALGDMTFWIPKGFPAIAIVILFASAVSAKVDVLVLQRKRLGIWLTLIAAPLVVVSECIRSIFVIVSSGDNAFGLNFIGGDLGWLILPAIYVIARVVYLLAYVVTILGMRLQLHRNPRYENR